MAVLDRLAAALTTLPLVPENTRTIINVGCGSFSTAPLLRCLYPQAVVIGIDPAWWLLRPTPDAWTIAAEGQRLPLAQTTTVDLALIRHPNVNPGRVRWQQVLTALCNRLAPYGVLLVSCYTRLEWQTCRKLLHNGCLRLPETQICPIPTKALPPVDLSGQDRYLLAVRHNTVADN